MRVVRLLLPLALGAVALGQGGEDAQKQKATPAVSALLQRILPLAPSRDAMKSLRFKGRLRLEEVDLSFELLARAPKECALYVYDTHDGTPVIVVSDGQGFLYDPVGGTLRWAKPARPLLWVEVRDGDLRFRCGFSWTDERTDDSLGDVLIGIPSIVEQATLARNVERLGDGALRVSARTARGNGLLVDLASADDVVPARLAIVVDDHDPPALVLDEIEVNGPLPKGAFLSLDPERWREAAPLVELPVPDMALADEETNALFGKLMGGLAYRLRFLEAKELPTELQDAELRKAKENDDRISKTLRAILERERARAAESAD